MNRSIRIIRPSAAGGDLLLPARIAYLESRGFNISYNKIASNSTWPFSSNTPELRARELEAALLDPLGDLILCAKGGYGASDLLPLLDWGKIAKSTRKTIVGFSDITALHSAIWSKLKRVGFHGPMPASELWGQTTQIDIEFLVDLMSGTTREGLIEAVPLNPCPNRTSGWLFGGCLSVLCNLIGTPYFPNDLSNAILFLEDTGENPGQILRHWNHLWQSGSIAEVSAIVLGDFGNMRVDLLQSDIKMHLAERSVKPVYSSRSFGHTSPNWSLPIGSTATIDSKKSVLEWTFSG